MKRRSFLKALVAAGASAVAAVVGVRAATREKSGNGIASEELLPPIRDPEAAMAEAREAVWESLYSQVPTHYDAENVEFSIAGQKVTGYADGSLLTIHRDDHRDEWLAPRMFPREESVPSVGTFKFPTDGGLVGWRKRLESAELSGWRIEGRAPETSGGTIRVSGSTDSDGVYEVLDGWLYEGKDA